MQKTHSLTQLTNSVTATASSPSADILIFKTNIQTQGDKFYIKSFLDRHPLISQWNIDLEDIDCVLRVVSTHLELQDIIDIVAARGYCCEELV